MDTLNINQTRKIEEKDFWDSLQNEILISNQRLTYTDIMSFVEQSFMFSMFFRGCSQLELIGFQTILNIKNNAYVMLIEFSSLDNKSSNKVEIDEIALHNFLKNLLQDTNHTIGPFITNRISILVSDDSPLSKYATKEESIFLSKTIMDALHNEFHMSVAIGIGNFLGINSVYTSFLEALACLYFCSPNQVLHVQDAHQKDDSHNFDYAEAEKHLLDAIRLHKIEAYDYFGLLMELIKPFNDETKRNKILEILVLASHAMRIDTPGQVFVNFTYQAKELMEISGPALIEWAFQKFIYITGYVKPQNSIDYSNRIVLATKEYLELHYADDISLEDVALQVNISPQYFSKLIKKTTGFNFIDWLSMLRVRKAKELLTNTNFTVKEVCFMVGYKDPNYFSRIFKKRIGITPSEYIKSSTYLNNKS